MTGSWIATAAAAAATAAAADGFLPETQPLLMTECTIVPQPKHSVYGWGVGGAVLPSEHGQLRIRICLSVVSV